MRNRKQNNSETKLRVERKTIGTQYRETLFDTLSVWTTSGVALSVCLFDCLPNCQSIGQSVSKSVCLSVCLSTGLSICWFDCLPNCESVSQSVSQSVCLPVCLYASLVCLPASLPVWPSASLSACLIVCLSVCKFPRLPVCPNTFLPDRLCDSMLIFLFFEYAVYVLNMCIV